jgi:glycine dehydrogenase
MDETVPDDIRSDKPLDLPQAISEFQVLESLQQTARKNKVFRSFIGLGFHDCIIPTVIQRNIFENPGWYTQYTPYQSEISQGRLEALLNFQTLVMDLTGMEVANASLLDEATAAAEAMTMLYRLRSRELVKRDAHTFFVSENCFPQTLEVMKTRAEPLGIELVLGDPGDFEFHDKVYGALVQNPDTNGGMTDYTGFIQKAHDAGALVVVAADLLSLTLITPPGEMGADAVVGSSQRFGVPMGYGGPHAAFFATRDEFKRQVPGRIIGVSRDAQGNKAYRMALQTREQHIRRERATSNICTAQALLAIMAGMYALYHGPGGLKAMAERIHALTHLLDREIRSLGYEQKNAVFFDTLKFDPGEGAKEKQAKIRSLALEAGMNFRYFDDGMVGIALDETATAEEAAGIMEIFARVADRPAPVLNGIDADAVQAPAFPAALARKSPYLEHPVFNQYHTETKMLRYIKGLENRDLSLTHSMIPLGSCTMKLNATTEMVPVSWPGFGGIHPFAPLDQVEGYLEMIQDLEKWLCEITGLSAVSFQPNSGAQGEYTGLLVIRAYLRDRGEPNRNIVLIPTSAHGTNPASGVMTGMEVVLVKCDEAGNIDLDNLKAKATKHKENLAALMVTYPSTHGVYEERIREVCDVIHECGGQVYMDGANMNAQVGLTNPAIIGADVCHLNLHKTFSIPHGGGGPGMGPIAVASHLIPFLPSHPFAPPSPGDDEKGIPAVSSTHFGSASILLISYAYIRMLGPDGLTDASRFAMLNANYVKARLENHFPVLYAGEKGRVAHELIFDFRPFKKGTGIEVEDVAKRLMDYGFHAPTVSFPVAGTLMVEPTESEAKDELDRFCDALIAIKEEIQAIVDGKADKKDNVLKNAPHTAEEAASDAWDHSYTRSQAVYPLPFLRINKFWPPVGRIDNVYGDRNVVCACPPLEAYAE